MAVYEGKEELRAVLTGRKGTFRPYQPLEPAEGAESPVGPQRSEGGAQHFDPRLCGGYLRVFCLQKTSAPRFIPETSSLPPPETPAGS